MGPKKTEVFYFSPNGTTGKAAAAVAEGIGLPYEIHDLTDFERRWERKNLTADTIAVIAMPVYGGRLPGISAEFFRCLRSSGSDAVVMVTYGSNMYGDALAEIKNLSQKKGFRVISAASVPTEHCMDKNIGAGRPDEKDIENLREYGKKVRELYKKEDIPQVDIPGGYPYKHRVFDVRVAPEPGENCLDCKKCADICPVKAINPANIMETDASRCLLCMKCVNECPAKCRSLKDEKLLSKLKMLEMLSAGRKKQEFIFG